MKSLIASTLQKAKLRFDAADTEKLLTDAKFYSAQLDSLALAAQSGDRGLTRSRQFAILNSREAMRVCLLQGLKGKDVLSAAELWGIAKTLTPQTNCGEAVYASERKKFGGGVRPIVQFGPKRRALQLLITHVLGAKFPKKPFDYNVRKRGPDQMALDALAAIKAGNEWAFSADVKDCYPSVQRKGMEKTLGLPKDVIDNVIFVPPEVDITYLSIRPSLLLDGAVREGLPQGSVTSGFVAGMLLGSVLEAMPSHNHAFLLADDTMVLAGDEASLNASCEAYIQALVSHPHGPLHPKHAYVTHLNQGIEMVKYNIKRSGFDGSVRIRPSTKSYRKLDLRVAEKIRSEDGLGAVAPMVVEWASHFPLVNWSEDYLQTVIDLTEVSALSMLLNGEV